MRVKEKLKELDVKASKSRGQNFVINDSLIDSIMNFASLNESENIVEIGPGLGALTKELYKIKSDIKVIEIEEKFANDLKQRFPKLEVINKDVISFDIINIHIVLFAQSLYLILREAVILCDWL